MEGVEARKGKIRARTGDTRSKMSTWINHNEQQKEVGQVMRWDGVCSEISNKKCEEAGNGVLRAQMRC
jgi:hypothetical protein